MEVGEAEGAGAAEGAAAAAALSSLSARYLVKVQHPSISLSHYLEKQWKH